MTRMRKTRGDRSACGFTVLELLVATAITAVLAALLISITAGVMSVWNRSRGALVSDNGAKIALDQIANDLEGLVLGPQQGTWFVATISGSQAPAGGDAGLAGADYSDGASKPSGTTSLDLGDREPIPPLSTLRFGHVGVWLRFFTTQQASNENTGRMSGVRAVAYQIARIPAFSSGSSAESRYYLFRSAVRPGPYHSDGSLIVESSGAMSTFTSGYDIVQSGRYNLPDPNNSGGADPGAIRRPDRSLILAGNVIDFGVRIFVRNEMRVEVERFPVDRTAGPSTPRWAFVTRTLPADPVPSVPVPYGLPDTVVYGVPSSVEVMIRVLTEQGAALIESIESGRLPPPSGSGDFATFWWETALANSRVYTRRIEISTSSP